MTTNNSTQTLSKERFEFATMYTQLPADKQAAAADLIRFAIANPGCGELLEEVLAKRIDISKVPDYIKRKTVRRGLQKH